MFKEVIMSTDGKNAIQEKLESAGKAVIDQNVSKAKGEAKNFWDKIAFWKKEKTPEEIQADVQKKYEKIEKKYQKSLVRADEAETEEEKEKAKEKATQKRDKSLKELQEKYPEQWKAIAEGQKKQEIKEQAEVTEGQAVADVETSPEKPKKTLWQKIAFWKKEKTPEEREEDLEKELAKAKKKYDKALKKAFFAETEDEKAAKEKKALEDYNKRLQKIEKKYPEEVRKKQEAEAKRLADIQAIGEREIALRDEAAQRHAAASQQRLEGRVDVSNAVKEAKSKVATPTEERKMATLKKWMKEVHLPEENAQKMIDKYGIDMAYRLTQRCMQEPDILMPEIDSRFKKIQNKSSKSIQYFLDLGTENAGNKSKVSKVTNLPFIEKEDTKGKDTQVAETSISLGVAAPER